MPWLRVGDTAATDTRVSALRVVTRADKRTRLEVFGFVVLAATVSAQNLTDGVLRDADLANIDARWKLLVGQACEAGLMSPTGPLNGRPAWAIVADDQLLHIMSRDEVEWNRTRDRDRRNPALAAPVRMRDGDACRYCTKAVSWMDRKGARGATLDHLNPGQAATSPDGAVVACRSCNSARRENPEALELRPAPVEPLYSPSTLDYLNRNRKYLSRPQQRTLQDRMSASDEPPESGKNQGDITADSLDRPGTGNGGRLGRGTGRGGTGRDEDRVGTPPPWSEAAS